MSNFNTNKDLVDYLVSLGVLKTKRIIEAFNKIDRRDFVIDELKDQAYLDSALPIGYGATISQPYVVAFMLELLNAASGEKILDIGSGSGWTTTLIAYLVGTKGRVFAIERIPELKEFGEENCAKYNFVEKGIAKFICADGSKGLAKEAPFDGIHAAASSANIPEEWRNQLKPGGRIVAPVNQSIWMIVKNLDGSFSEYEYPGFVFVPLVKE
jgi:protein-L-isoaspartate(D-aspartate) O-methyltransferase